MASWSFLTNHARALLCIAHDPGVRVRDLAAMIGVTERSAHTIVSDLVLPPGTDRLDATHNAVAVWCNTSQASPAHRWADGSPSGTRLLRDRSRWVDSPDPWWAPPISPSEAARRKVAQSLRHTNARSQQQASPRPRPVASWW